MLHQSKNSRSLVTYQNYSYLFYFINYFMLNYYLYHYSFIMKFIISLNHQSIDFMYFPLYLIKNLFLLKWKWSFKKLLMYLLFQHFKMQAFLRGLALILKLYIFFLNFFSKCHFIIIIIAFFINLEFLNFIYYYCFMFLYPYFN